MPATSQLVFEAENGPTAYEARTIVLFSSSAVFRLTERYLLSIISLLEVAFGFKVKAFCVWTKRNVLFDQVGRRTKRGNRSWLEHAQEYVDEWAPGMTEASVGTLLRFFTTEGGQAKIILFWAILHILDARGHNSTKAT